MYDFRVNQKVVCIEDSVYKDIGSCCKEWIKKGEIYIIRWVGLYDFDFHKDYLAVRLEGISRDVSFKKDIPFDAKRFRPLIKVEDFMENVDIKELENV